MLVNYWFQRYFKLSFAVSFFHRYIVTNKWGYLLVQVSPSADVEHYILLKESHTLHRILYCNSMNRFSKHRM